ncbi:MAG: serine/threonine-protein kinase [Sulfolobus sp.]
MRKPQNDKLFSLSIFSTIVILVAFFATRNYLLLASLIGPLSSIKTSYNRKYSLYSMILSLLSAAVSSPTYSLPLSFLISVYLYFDFYTGLIFFLLIEAIMFVITLSYSVIPPYSVPPVLYDLLTATPLALLTVANYRAYKGKDYKVVTFKTVGIPRGTPWFIELDNNVINSVDDELRVVSEGGTWITCPVKVGDEYYLPKHNKGVCRSGDEITIFFERGDEKDLNKFEECLVTFVATGLPKGVTFSVEVNGKKYSGKEIIKVPAIDNSFIIWRAFDVKVSDIVFQPKVSMGTTIRGKVVGIEFEPKIISKQLDLKNWDPKVWVDRDVYGYKVTDVIGEGGYSYVLKAEKDGKYYAIKILKPARSLSQTVAIREFVDIFKESNNLIKLSDNPHLVRINGIFADVNQIGSILKGDTEIYLKYPPAIIMDFMRGGTAKELIHFREEKEEWYEIVKIIIKHVALALKHIHDNGYVHLDVKPQNIFFEEPLGDNLTDIRNKLIQNPKIIKLGDLGSASKIGEKFFQISPAYGSPMQLEHAILGLGAEPSFDIFSLGITGYYLLTGNASPVADYLDRAIDFYNNNDIATALKIVNEAKTVISNWNPSIPQNVPMNLRNVIINCIKGTIKEEEITRLLQ